jgi:short-subunit dehydrogenase
MADRIKDRVAIVTGASRGIGEAIARQLVAKGAQVVLAARDIARLEAIQQELGEAAFAVQCDVADRAQVSAMVQATLERFGRVEILINNAGIGLSGVIADFDLDDLERVFAVNVFGVVACIQAVIPPMRAQKWGHIVNISSILGKRAVPQTAGYAASKFALQALSDGLRVEEAPHNIAVSVICPGSTETDFRDNELQSGSKLLNERPRVNLKSADDVAAITLKAINRRSREIVVSPFGKFFNVLEKALPSAVDMALKRTYHK